MPQTSEQKTATDALDVAIKDVLRTYGWDVGDTPLVTGWVVCVAQQGFDDEGDAVTAYSHLYPNGEMASHSILGILRAVQLRVEADLVREA